MSASRCMRPLVLLALRHDVAGLRVVAPPVLREMPEVCPHTDCGEPRNCRQRAKDWLNALAKINKG